MVAQALPYSSDLHLAASLTERARFRSHWARQAKTQSGEARGFRRKYCAYCRVCKNRKESLNPSKSPLKGEGDRPQAVVGFPPAGEKAFPWEAPKPAAPCGIGAERRQWRKQRGGDRNCKGALARPLLFPEPKQAGGAWGIARSACATMRVPRGRWHGFSRDG